MKKLLAIILTMVLAATTFSIVFAADPKVTCTVSDADVQLGEEFTVTVSISGFEPVRSGGFALDFDQSVLEFVNIEWLTDLGLPSFDEKKLNVAFMFFPLEAHDINGDVFRLTLRALADAPKAGSFDIVVTPTNLINSSDNVVDSNPGTASIEVSCAEHKYGNLIPEVPAACGVEGTKAHYQCSVCQKLFNQDKQEITAQDLVIPALTHVAEQGWHSDADNHWKICANPGCDHIIDGTTAAHTFEWVVDTPATEDTTGTQHEQCTVCGYTRSEGTTIPQLPHVHTGITQHEVVAATCYQTGTVEYWTCSSDKCAGKYYSDATCTTEIFDITTPIDPDNHTGGTEIRGAVSPTCTTDGYSGDTYCLGCKQKIADGKTLPATGKHVDADNTWESDSTNHWHTCGCGQIFDQAAHTGGTATCMAKAVCSVCGTEYGNIDPDNHVNTEVRDAVAATEESEGYTGDTWCLDCGKMIAQGTVTPKLDHTHNMVKTDAKPATCEEDGNIEYYTCTKCGKIYNDKAGTKELTEEDIVIKANGHNFGTDWTYDNDNHWHQCVCGERKDVDAHTFGDWETVTEATATENGSQQRKCSVCGHVQTKVINATGTPEDDNQSGTVDSPQTGDNRSMLLWVVLLAASSALSAPVVLKKKFFK